MLKVDILTLFPRMLDGFLSESILGKAVRNKLLEVKVWNIRDFAKDKHKMTDDRPFGGGAGMLLKPEPLWDAIDSLKTPATRVIYLCPDGELFNSNIAQTLAKQEHLILISGHYEGIDQRVRDHCVDQELSIGGYILTNGTLAAAIVLDASSRYIEGVLGEEKSLTQDTFTDNLLSFPQYTRPVSYRGYTVPEVLLSGNHPEIGAWRSKMQYLKTQSKRPDLLK